MKLGIRAKIILIPAAIVLLAVAGGTSLVAVRIRSDAATSLQQVSWHKADSLRHQIERLLALDLQVGEIEGFDAQCREVLRGTPLTGAWVADNSGKILFSSGPLTLPPEALPAQAGQDKPVALSFVASLEGTAQALSGIALPIRDSGEVVGWTMTAFPQELLDQRAAQVTRRLTVSAVTALGVTLVLLWIALTILVLRPMSRLLSDIRSIHASGDLAGDIHGLESADEIGDVATAFNAMLDGIRSRDATIHQHLRDLEEANARLEDRVAARTADLHDANRHLEDEMARRQEAELRKDQIHAQLVETSRKAGMADVATGVLHNVGNVLNSANVASELLIRQARGAPVAHLRRLLRLLTDHRDRLAEFLTTDPRGRNVVEFLEKLTDNIEDHSRRQLEELENLSRSVAHMKEIVAMQQSLAVRAGVVATMRLREIIEDAIKINLAGLDRHGVQVRHDMHDPDVELRSDSHKVLQILINLISNAKYAVSEIESGPRDVVVSTRPTGDGRVAISVIDTGKGIDPMHMPRLFQFGFTTKKDGHGFGLHTSALAAREIGGELTCDSAGPGKGATFTLTIPLSPDNEQGKEVRHAA